MILCRCRSCSLSEYMVVDATLCVVQIARYGCKDFHVAMRLTDDIDQDDVNVTA